ncbi:MAG: chromate efflux transporter [Hyphomicrobiaceae bacterium]|nr:chromate efflux transporter [Hyphomicrobiaceae bacterium]
MSDPIPHSGTEAHSGSASEVFWAFLKLGLISFGGPVAHLGYFREAFVARRQWFDDKVYSELVALGQFLPGPASSQVGFALGLMRAGWLGALAAFAGFTLPSALLMFGFAYGAPLLGGKWGEGLIHGLKIVAVAIVAQAVWGMARSLCPDRQRAGIALAAIAMVAFAGGAAGQISAIVAGALAGLVLVRQEADGRHVAFNVRVSRPVAIAALVLFAFLLVGVPLAAGGLGGGLVLFDSFYRAGALVFGGGHVVLPLLQSGLVDPGFVSHSEFLAGYGAAQTIPGPLFTFAAYLGAITDPGPGGVVGALIALAGIFLPGFLLMVGVLPFWARVRQIGPARQMMAGANAAVVGILAAALYDPVFVNAVVDPRDFALAALCFVLLTVFKAPSWIAVLVAALGGVCLAYL